MIFQVTRTSMFEGKPWKDCIPIQLTRVESRTFHTPEEFDKKFSEREGKWLEKGTNHRINARGYITRDMELVNEWGIEINSLEELMNFQKEVGTNLVLETSYIDGKTPCIEIYDDYRE